jgi:hypothetical protein
MCPSRVISNNDFLKYLRRSSLRVKSVHNARKFFVTDHVVCTALGDY